MSVDTVALIEGDFLIVKSERPFGTGWNVYKADAPGSGNYTKINERWSFFRSFEAAETWLNNYRRNGCSPESTA